MPLISKDILLKICPNLNADRAFSIADSIDFICNGYKITNRDILRELVANMAFESGGFRIKEENMNYTTPQRIVDIWPTRFNLDGSNKKLNANQYIRNPKKLANAVYNGRMGNKLQTDDGYNFRGSGFLQGTGREFAEDYAKWWSNPSPEDIVNRCRTEDWWAIDSACWEYAVSLKLLPMAVGDNNFKAIVKKINGGYIGLPERQIYFDRCKIWMN